MQPLVVGGQAARFARISQIKTSAEYTVGGGTAHVTRDGPAIAKVKILFNNPTLVKGVCNGMVIELDGACCSFPKGTSPGTDGAYAVACNSWVICRQSDTTSPWDDISHTSAPPPQQQQLPAMGSPPRQQPSSGYGPDRGRPGSLPPQPGSSGPYSGGVEQLPRSVPVAQLQPFLTRASIKVRCTNVGNLRKWSNARGEGHVCGFGFADSSAEIPATAFGKAAEKFYDELKEGSIYVISKIRIKPQNDKFRVGTHPCQIELDESSIIQPAAEDDVSIPKVALEPVKISELEHKQKDDTVDVAAVLIGAGELQSISLKSGQQKAKRDFTLMDDSGTAISIALWGDDAHVFTEDQVASAQSGYRDNSEPVIVCIKNAKVDEYNGKNLKKVFQSKIMVNDTDIPHTRQLRQWYLANNANGNEPSRSLSSSMRSQSTPVMSIADLKGLQYDSMVQEALDGRGVWFQLRAVIANVNFDGKPRYYWEACQICGKTVKDGQGDTYSLAEGNKYCNTCNKPVGVVKKWMAKCTLMDATGSITMTAFGEKAEPLFQATADDAYTLSLDPSATDTEGRCFDDVRLRPNGKTFIVRGKAYYRTWQDTRNIDFTMNDVQELHTDANCRRNETKRLVDFLKMI